MGATHLPEAAALATFFIDGIEGPAGHLNQAQSGQKTTKNCVRKKSKDIILVKSNTRTCIFGLTVSHGGIAHTLVLQGGHVEQHVDEHGGHQTGSYKSPAQTPIPTGLNAHHELDVRAKAINSLKFKKKI